MELFHSLRGPLRSGGSWSVQRAASTRLHRRVQGQPGRYHLGLHHQRNTSSLPMGRHLAVLDDQAELDIQVTSHGKW